MHCRLCAETVSKVYQAALCEECYGCAGIVRDLRRQLAEVQDELNTVRMENNIDGEGHDRQVEALERQLAEAQDRAAIHERAHEISIEQRAKSDAKLAAAERRCEAMAKVVEAAREVEADDPPCRNICQGCTAECCYHKLTLKLANLDRVEGGGTKR